MSNDFIDTSKFPDPNKINSRQDYENWMNEVLRFAGNPNMDPMLNDPGETNQYETMPPFEALSGVGDPRFSMGHMLVSAVAAFMPRVQLFQEIKQAGGCQVINNYICDSDGVPIQEVTTSCPVGMSYEAIQPQEIIDFVQQTMQGNIQKDVDAFANYIKLNYLNKGYKAIIYEFLNISAFIIIKLYTDTNTVYLKYYHSDIKSLASSLNIPITVFDFAADPAATASFITMDMMSVMSSPIPLYNNLPVIDPRGWGYGFV